MMIATGATTVAFVQVPIQLTSVDFFDPQNFFLSVDPRRHVCIHASEDDPKNQISTGS